MTDASPDAKIRHRLSVLELADRLGNVAESCRLAGVDRSSFYKWRRRYRSGGIAALADLTSAPHQPKRTGADLQQTAIEAAHENPTWGVARLSALLRDRGMGVSRATVHRILRSTHMSTRAKRLVVVEMVWRGHWGAAVASRLGGDQLQAAERANPAFRERHTSGTRPGELLVQGTLFVDSLPGPTHLFVQVAIDTASGFAFARVHIARGEKHAISLLHNQVLPFFFGWGVPVHTIQTGRGTEYWGRPQHQYGIYLEAHGIQHRVSAASAGPRLNGHIATFSRDLRRGLIGWLHREISARPLGHDDGLPMQENLDTWLRHYNTEIRRPGFPTWGSTRAETFHANNPQR